MLEKMIKTAAARRVVALPHIIPDIDRNRRRAGIANGIDGRPVGQDALGEIDPGHLQQGGCGGFGPRGCRDIGQGAGREQQDSQKSAHRKTPCFNERAPLHCGAALSLRGITRPRCMTNSGRSVARISVSGLPGTATISARSEEHTSELQSLMRTSYAVFCLKKKKKKE